VTVARGTLVTRVEGAVSDPPALEDLP
jgi:hypothetical protein